MSTPQESPVTVVQLGPTFLGPPVSVSPGKLITDVDGGSDLRLELGAIQLSPEIVLERLRTGQDNTSLVLLPQKLSKGSENALEIETRDPWVRNLNGRVIRSVGLESDKVNKFVLINEPFPVLYVINPDARTLIAAFDSLKIIKREIPAFAILRFRKDNILQGIIGVAPRACLPRKYLRPKIHLGS